MSAISGPPLVGSFFVLMVGQARRNDFDTVTAMKSRKLAVTLSSAATYIQQRVCI